MKKFICDVVMLLIVLIISNAGVLAQEVNLQKYNTIVAQNDEPISLSANLATADFELTNMVQLKAKSDVIEFKLDDFYKYKQWLSTKDIVSAGCFFINGMEIPVAIFSMEGNFFDWLTNNTSNDPKDIIGSKKFLKIDKSFPLNKAKYTSFDAYYLIHDDLRAPILRLLIPLNNKVLSISIENKQNDLKILNFIFKKIVNSLYINNTKVLIDDPSNNESDTQLKNLDTYYRTKNKQVLNQYEPSSIYYGIGHKLPWPKEQTFYVTQGWDMPLPDYSHNGLDKYAYDFGLPEGTELRATRGGVVTFIEKNKNSLSCGDYNYKNEANFVVIQHDDGSSTGYWHLQNVYVSLNSEVNQGQVLGTSGKTGWTYCGAHLHFRRGNSTNSSYPQSVEIYFQEYPNTQLFSGVSYTSQNNGGQSCGGSNVLLQNININGAFFCTATNTITILPNTSFSPGANEMIFRIQ